jgi:F0F1-type ATP synthase assembly protein I
MWAMADGRRRNPLRLSTAGVEFIGTFALLLAGGYLLDSWLGRWITTRPAFTIWGGVIGFAFALYRLVKQAKSGAADNEPYDENDYEEN